MSIIAIDWDGVIHDYLHPKPGRRMGLPIEGSKESIELLKRAGHNCIIHTVWDESRGKVIDDWLSYYGFPSMQVTNNKPLADFYLDDHGLKFTDWPTALEDIYGTSSKTRSE
jgi:hypothetical protein